MVEIEGKNTFPCAKCGKSCKSKGGLTRHVRSNHKASEEDKIECPIGNDTVTEIVESIKREFINDDLYGTDINESLSNVTNSEKLTNALQPYTMHFSPSRTNTK